jgi:hypothetical protein
MSRKQQSVAKWQLSTAIQSLIMLVVAAWRMVLRLRRMSLQQRNTAKWRPIKGLKIGIGDVPGIGTLTNNDNHEE